MSEIAQAFVRVRPNTTGFEAEAEGGVRSAFGRLARIAAAAFAVERGFEFGKEIIGHAADVQKQVEAVKNEFGTAADEIIRFGENAAASLGLSNHEVETTAARFGIIFRNLNIGTQQAADMTIGFEKLAGSLSLIRNVDPTAILRNIPLAIQGNLRSLKQLGIATDQTQLKLAAFKLGLTDSITQALTPSTRAQAIYAVATAHLGDFLRQAAAHTTDLATRQRILSAIWDNAKDRLGQGLIPAASTIVELFARGLPRALDITGRVFSDLRDVITGFVSFVAPAFRPIIAEVGRLGDAFRGGGIRGALDQLKDDFLSLSPIAKIAVVAIAGVGAAVAATVIAAAPITFTITAIAGLAVAFKEAYDRSSRFRETVQHLGQIIQTDVLPPLRRIGTQINEALGSAASFIRSNVLPAILTIGTAIKDSIGSAVSFVQSHLRIFEILGGAVAGAAAGFVALRIATAAYEAVAKTAIAVQLAFDAALDANPIGIIVIAIAALIGALVVLYTRSATVHRVVNEAFDGIRHAVEASLPTIRRIGDALLDAARSVAGFFTGTIIPAAQSVATALTPVFRELAKTIITAFRDGVAVVHTFAEALKPVAEIIVGAIVVGVRIAEAVWRHFGGLIKTIVRNDFGAIAGVVRGALQVVRGIIDVVTGLITGDWGKAWDGIKTIFSGAWTAIKGAATGFADDLHAIFSTMWRGIERLFLEGIEKIVSLLAAIPSVHAHIPHVGTVGFTNPFKGADADLKAAIAGLSKSGKDAADAAGATVASSAADAGAKAAAGLAKIPQAIHAAARAAVNDVVGRGADSAEAAAQAATAATTAQKAVTDLTDKITRTVTVSDAQIGKLRAKIRGLGVQIADAIKQEAIDVRDSVNQAEQNLGSIGQSLASSIGQIIDKPLQDAQDKISRAANKQSLENLRRQVILPGGGGLSANPQQALSQLEALAKSAGNTNRAAINDFISRYKSAVLAVQQDQANVTKNHATRTLADLTDQFNNGKLTVAQYRKAVLAELSRDHVSYRRAGSLLGTAFANGFKSQVKGLFDQAAAISAVPAGRRQGVNPLAPSIIRPLDTLRDDQKKIATLTHRKMDTQTALQTRIAKAVEKTAALNKQLAEVVINSGGVRPSTKDKTPGKGAKNTRDLNGTTG